MNRAELSYQTRNFVEQLDRGHPYPLGRCILSLCGCGHVPTDLRAVNEDLAAQLPGQRSGGGLILPAGVVFNRASLGATTGSLGGALVQTAVAPTLAAWRGVANVMAAGATVLDNLRANQSLPTLGGVSALIWLNEGDPASSLNELFGDTLNSPKRCAGYLNVSNQLLKQSAENIEAVILTDLRAAAGAALDAAALVGSGSGGQPTGILNTGGTGGLTFGGAAEIADFSGARAVLEGIGAPGPYSIMASPAAVAKWRGAPRSATLVGLPLLDESGTIAEMRVFADVNLAASNKVVIGSFPSLGVLIWGIELLSNPYSLSLNHQTVLVINLLADVRVARPSGFVVSTDSGAQ